MKNSELLFFEKFRQASFIYLTINDNLELRKHLKDVFSDIWDQEYYFEYAIQNIDENYLNSKLYERFKSLLKNHPNRGNKLYIVLDFITSIVNKVHSADGYYEFDDDFAKSSALKILTLTEKDKFEKVVNDIEYMPLLKALDLPHRNESGEFINKSNYEFTRDLLNMVDQSAINRFKQNP